MTEERSQEGVEAVVESSEPARSEVVPEVSNIEIVPPVIEPAPPAPEEPRFPMFAEALGWLGAAGLSVGMAAATLPQWSSLPDWILRNKLDPSARNLILGAMGAGLLLFVLPALFVLVRGGWAKLGAVHREAMRWSPLAVVGPLPAMLNDRAWVNFEFVFATLAAALCFVSYITLKQSLEQPSTPGLFQRLAQSQRAPVVIAIVAAIFYSLWFSAFTLSAHYQLVTSSFDLGIEDNIVWQAAHWGPMFRTTPLGGPMTHLGYHQTYFSYLIAIPYRIWPDAKFLLVLQACMLGGAAFVLFLLARARIGAWSAAALTWAYVLYPPLHGANLYDFHYQPLSIIFLFSLVLCAERGWWKRMALVVLLTMSLREDMGLMMAVVCTWLALRNIRPGLMLGFIGLGLVHFVLLKLIIMPRFLGGASSYINQYQGMVAAGDAGFGGVLKTLLANPGYTMNWLLEPGKQQYVMQVLGPVLFLPLLRRQNLVLLLPGFFFTLLSTNFPPLMMISFQYSAYWIPFVFLAVVSTLAWLQDKSVVIKHAVLATLLLGTLLHTRQFGAVLHIENVHAQYSGGYHLIPTEAERTRRADFDVLAAQVPRDARVVASEWLVPQFSAREFIYTMRNGLMQDAEYLITALPRHDEMPRIREALDGEFGVVDVRGEFMLARRHHPKDRNGEARRWLGR